MSVARSPLVLLPTVLCLAGCFGTETEVITPGQSVRLCGKRFSIQMKDGDDGPTRFTWNDGPKAYVDADAQFAVRFARFKGDVYLTQSQVLRDPDETSPAAAPSKGYAVGFVRLIDGRLSLVLEPDCRSRSVDMESVARGYGVTFMPGGYVPGLKGPRAGILGFLTVVAGCDLDPPPHMALPIDTESVSPGGPELASQGGSYEGDLFAEPERRTCEGGDLRACYRLGVRYAKGDGVKRDPPRAVPLLARACDGGPVAACLDLGELYDRGDGVPRDTVRAHELYRKACDGGEPFACEQLKRP